MPTPIETMSFRKVNLISALAHFADATALSVTGQNICQPHLNRLTKEFYAFSDYLVDPMISLGLGNSSMDDLWENVEYFYIACRLRTGISFTDNFVKNCPEYEIGKIADQFAKSQSYLESGVYLGDDDIFYIADYS